MNVSKKRYSSSINKLAALVNSKGMGAVPSRRQLVIGAATGTFSIVGREWSSRNIETCTKDDCCVLVQMWSVSVKFFVQNSSRIRLYIFVLVKVQRNIIGVVKTSEGLGCTFHNHDCTKVSTIAACQKESTGHVRIFSFPTHDLRDIIPLHVSAQKIDYNY